MVGKKHFRDWAADLLLERRPFDEALTFYGLVPYFEAADGTRSGAWHRPFVLNGEELLPSRMELEREPFYQTDAFTDYALRFLDRAHASGKPFFLYLPYHAPHYPLQARAEDIARYRDTYRAGWDAIRAERFRRQRELGAVPANARLSTPGGETSTAFASPTAVSSTTIDPGPGSTPPSRTRSPWRWPCSRRWSTGRTATSDAYSTGSRPSASKTPRSTAPACCLSSTAVRVRSRNR